jgi:hypothetical protein
MTYLPVVIRLGFFCWRMIFPDLASPAEASGPTTTCAKGFAQAGNRYPSRIKCGTGFFGIMRYRASHSGTRLIASSRAAGLVAEWAWPEPSAEKASPLSWRIGMSG